MRKFKRGEIIWLGDLAPQWAKDLKNQREMGTDKLFLPFNGYGRILTQFDDIVELQAMVGQPNGGWDARVIRVGATELAQNQSADIQRWKSENGWD